MELDFHVDLFVPTGYLKTGVIRINSTCYQTSSVSRKKRIEKCEKEEDFLCTKFIYLM